MRDQAGKLHEHGDPDHSSGDVHPVLGSWLRRRSSHVCIAPGHCLDERMWCAGKSSLHKGEGACLATTDLRELRMDIQMD